jgi:NAD(P)-dependent dehydrogenase (short-subunit alcohol dehydrogenase family)
MGRELVVQLVEQGCNVAMCDINLDAMAETRSLAHAKAPSSDIRITDHICDVADEAAVEIFRDEVLVQHDIDHINLLFNNAGVGGGGSFVAGDRAEWERTFEICWGGVYAVARVFVPLLVASDEGVIVNTSSVNGFWAALGPGIPHTAYSAAKFAVKGFTEALIEDLRMNAPHVTAAVVMPGHIGTEIVNNSRKMFGGVTDAEAVRQNMIQRGMPADAMSDDDLLAIANGMGDMFRDGAPLTASQAATIILDAVKAGQWRILVGDDAHLLDEAVRADPHAAYGPDGLSLGVLQGDPQ